MSKIQRNLSIAAFFLSSLLGGTAIAETYICDSTGRENRLKRISNSKFDFQTVSNGNMPIDVLHEDQQYLVLGGLFDYNGRWGYLVRYLNKQTLEMRSSVTMNPKEIEYENQIYDQCRRSN
jgi:hypothetical protein